MTKKHGSLIVLLALTIEIVVVGISHRSIRDTESMLLLPNERRPCQRYKLIQIVGLLEVTSIEDYYRPTAKSLSIL